MFRSLSETSRSHAARQRILSPVQTPKPDDAASQLHEFLGAGPALVLTGAGMSTDSGIPDYRRPDGTRRALPMQHGEFVGSSGARQRYWARSFIGWQRFSAADPNDGHRALARLASARALGTIITQNVDGLHQRAGSPDVIELHGSLSRVVCLSCGTAVGRDALQQRMASENAGFERHSRGMAPDGSQVGSQIRPDGDIVLDQAAVAHFHSPVCAVCRSDTLKPDVVFFGGSVPPDRVAQCVDRTDRAPSLLVLGSSLAVMSGLRFVRQAARRGIPIAIVTRGATRGDDLATLRLDVALTPTLVALTAKVGERPCLHSDA